MENNKKNWRGLRQELEAWHDSGLQASFWWRDDDAIEPTPALQNMLTIASTHAAPLALAVIPAHATSELANLLNPRADISILQHGYAHINFSGGGEKKSELSGHRNLETILDELTLGQQALLKFDHAQPVLVPPWNRISREIRKALPGLGFKGISTFNARSCAFETPNLFSINTHVDLIDWHGTRGFIGADAALNAVLVHLKNKRLNTEDANEPTGLLSHHLVHDAACWDFMDDLLGCLNTHDGANIVSISEALPI